MKVYKLIPHRKGENILLEFAPVGVKKGHSRRKHLYAVETDGKYRLLVSKYGKFYASPPLSEKEVREKYPKAFMITRQSQNLKFIPERAIEVFSMEKLSVDDLFLKVFRECLSES